MEAVKTAIKRTLAVGRKPSGLVESDFPDSFSLSNYFPAGTIYFYGYPAGADADFLLRVPTETEELVAARALSCAGPEVSVVTFAATQPSAIGRELADKFGIPRLTARQTITLPTDITSSAKGKHRDRMIMSALKMRIPRGKLVMAQPYSDEAMSKFFQIRPMITAWLNDKTNMSQYIPSELLPKRLAFFNNGGELAEAADSLDLPCVIKVSSSSSGDGVCICLGIDDIRAAVERLKNLEVKIFVEEYVLPYKNYGLHFGIPADRTRPIDIIGANEQLTTPAGAFIGGRIMSSSLPAELVGIARILQEQILPVVREFGWHGIGCFDVIHTTDGQFRFIDCNFRMTGMSAYHLLSASGKIKAPLLGFAGEFKGNQSEFEEALSKFAAIDSAERCVRMITLACQSGVWRFNAAMTFSDETQLKRLAFELLRTGIESDALESILK